LNEPGAAGGAASTITGTNTSVENIGSFTIQYAVSVIVFGQKEKYSTVRNLQP